MEDKVKFVEDFLDSVKDIFGIKEYKTSINEDVLYIDLQGDNLDYLIDRNGNVLNSLQYLLIISVNNFVSDYLRIILDYDGFRNKRSEYLKSLCDRLANIVLKTDQMVTLEPMNPFERRLIHSYISGLGRGIHSKSVGKDPNRSVVIYPGSNLEVR